RELIVEQVQERIHRVVTAVQFANVLGMATILWLTILWLMYRKRYFVEHVVMAFHFLAFLYLCTILSWPLDPIMGGRQAVPDHFAPEDRGVRVVSVFGFAPGLSAEGCYYLGQSDCYLHLRSTGIDCDSDRNSGGRRGGRRQVVVWI